MNFVFDWPVGGRSLCRDHPPVHRWRLRRGVARSAQTAATPKTDSKPPAAAAATSSKPETVEQRITALKSALKITPGQEAKWRRRQGDARNAAAMEKLVKEKKAKTANMNAVDDLKTYQDFTKARLDGLNNLRRPSKCCTSDAGRPEEERRPGVPQFRPLLSRRSRAEEDEHDQTHPPVRGRARRAGRL